ncbi:MAG: tetratricopeptide repeat protein [Planctomycetota bacterium]
MSKGQLKIPKFQSLEEFHIWWQTPEVIQFCQNNPDKIVTLQQHYLVKTWLEQLNIKSESPQATQTQPKTFGKYILEKKLGQGGMGTVYLASDLVLKHQVALKIMTPARPEGRSGGVEDQELTERFNREAQAMAKLKHPNIIQVYEVGTIGRYHYFTMKYIQGASLEDLIKDNPSRRRNPANTGKNRLSPRYMANIIRDTALALDYAHKQGIIHRDIKPANILIDSNEHPYLMDFGLAKELTGLDRSLTMSGSIMGTPDYMSPEQAMGNKRKIDHRSDIFSLGATFYHCITGRLPFESKELYQVLNQVIHKDPIPPSRLTRGLSKDLETICLKCMDKEKEKRYQTSKELADDISRYLEGESISAKPIRMMTKILKKAKKNKIASFSVVGTIVIITIIIGILVSSTNKKQEIEKYRTRTYKEFNMGKYEEVITLCNKLLIISPQDEEMKSLLKKSQSLINEREDKIQTEKEARNKREEAKNVLDRINTGNPTPDYKIKTAKKALEIDPGYGEAYQVMGYAYKDKMVYNKAFEYFSKAIEKSPALIYSYFERAKITAYIRNNLEGAIPDFNKVIELDLNSHIGYCAKGNISYYEKNYDDAITHYHKAIEINPNYAEAFYNLGSTYKEKSDFSEAITNFNRAIELNPNYEEAYNIRGLVFCQQGDIDSAINDFSKAIDINPNYANAYLNRGLAYQQKGDFENAMSDGEMLMKLTSANHQLPIQIQDLLEQLGKQLPNKENTK